MITSRLSKIEKKLIPKELPYVLCYQYMNGIFEYNGKRYGSKEEFVTANNPKNVIYMMMYKDLNTV